MLDKGQCISSGCKNSKHSRGLCSGCYSYLRTRIFEGELTWEEAEEEDLILPRDKKGRSRKEQTDG